jgi:hypothetical protein
MSAAAAERYLAQPSTGARLAAADWPRLTAEIDERGFAVLPACSTARAAAPSPPRMRTRRTSVRAW